MYGALVDYVTQRTGGNQPERGYGYAKTFPECRENWRRKFIEAKKLVECFGVDYEPTSEEETITVGYGTKPHPDASHRRQAAKIGFNAVVTDYDKRHPEYRQSVHLEACQQAAKRVVRKWKEGQ